MLAPEMVHADNESGRPMAAAVSVIEEASSLPLLISVFPEPWRLAEYSFGSG